MSLVSVLHDLVCAEARISPSNGNELHLLETDASASLRKVVLALCRLPPQCAAGCLRRGHGGGPAGIAR
jgi:hypothetical protein